MVVVDARTRPDAKMNPKAVAKVAGMLMAMAIASGMLNMSWYPMLRGANAVDVLGVGGRTSGGDPQISNSSQINRQINPWLLQKPHLKWSSVGGGNDGTTDTVKMAVATNVKTHAIAPMGTVLRGSWTTLAAMFRLSTPT